MNNKAISTEIEYQAALKEAALLIEIDPAPGTIEGDRLNALAMLIQAFESHHFEAFQPNA